MERKMLTGEAEDFALAVLDVNGLKHINDTIGHQAGDEYIKKACRMICLYFAHSPVYRTGGDEFVVLLQGPDYGNRTAILEQFRREAEAHIVTNDVVILLGCTDYRPGEDRSLRELFERADERMYENKKTPEKTGRGHQTVMRREKGFPIQIEEVDPSCQIVI